MIAPDVMAWRAVFADERAPAYWVLQRQCSPPLASLHRVAARDWRGAVWLQDGTQPVGSWRSRDLAMQHAHALLGRTYRIDA